MVWKQLRKGDDTEELFKYLEGDHFEKNGQFEIPDVPLVTKANEIRIRGADGKIIRRYKDQKILNIHGKNENGVWKMSNGDPVIDFIDAYNNANRNDPIQIVAVCNPTSGDRFVDSLKIDHFNGEVIYAEGSDVKFGYLPDIRGDGFSATLSLLDSENGTWHGLESNFEYKTTYSNREQLTNLYQKLNQAAPYLATRPFRVSGHKHLWFDIKSGNVPRRENDEPDRHYRGYLMVEPKHIPELTVKLANIGLQRAREGKYLHAKALVGYDSVVGNDLNNESFKNDPIRNSKFGTYTGLPIRDPRIVIYADTRAEVEEILQELYDQGWDKYEQRRLRACGGKAPRRPGAGEFRPQGKNFGLRAMNINKKPGYSEDVVDKAIKEGRDWEDEHPLDMRTMNLPTINI